MIACWQCNLIHYGPLVLVSIIALFLAFGMLSDILAQRRWYWFVTNVQPWEREIDNTIFNAKRVMQNLREDNINWHDIDGQRVANEVARRAPSIKHKWLWGAMGGEFGS